MKTLISIVAYLFSNIKFGNAKSGAQFERTASPRPARPSRRPATQTGKVEQRVALINWPDGRATVMVI